ncbi:MAG: YihY/virulence factor BrkB family protein [Propionibacteriaceae bacterium]|nr:YihY/virulence factor BrkB family protein [Propionibacteriaceae bacterium]
MKDFIDKVMNKPVVAHAMAANDRYNKRLGPQFAAAVTYFTVLSMVPILMFSFAMLGFTLTVLRPDLLTQAADFISSLLAEANLGDTAEGEESIGDKISAFIESTLSGWRGVFGVALLTAAYSGSNWVGNLKRAVRVMWSDKFSDATVKKNFFLELLVNLGTFLGLLLAVGVGVAVAQTGHGLSQQIIGWLGWENVPGIGFLWRLITLALTFVVSWLLMAFLFIVLPRQAVRPKAWLIGTTIGAVLITILQSAAGLLMGVFSGNAAAGVFGPIIVMMLLFNLLATIILMTAAWVGTEDTWAADRARAVLEKDLTPDVDIAIDEEQLAAQRASQRWAATRDLDDLRRATSALPEPNPETHVRQDVAARGMKMNLKIGYGVGTATGLGLGALIVGVLRFLTRR